MLGFVVGTFAVAAASAAAAASASALLVATALFWVGVHAALEPPSAIC